MSVFGTPAAETSLPRQRFSGLRPLLYQLLSYMLVGVTNLIVTLTVLNALVFFGGIDGGWRLVLANVIATGLAVVNSYVWNSMFTFRSGALLHGQLFVRFLVVNLAGFVINQAIFTVIAFSLLQQTDLHTNVASTLAQLCAIAVQFVCNFTGLRFWAYRVAPQAAPAPPPLAAGVIERPLAIDVELTSIAAGEREARAIWRARYWIGAYAGVAGLLLIYGWYSTLWLEMNNGDGTARVTQAFAVLFSRDPHLGALSLIWPPIPAVSDLPIVALLQPFGHAFYAGSIMGALYTAGAVLLFFACLREIGTGKWTAALLSLALLTNQHIYQSAAAGLSEAPSAFFLLASLLYFLKWMKSEESGQLIIASLTGSAATMCRYEAMFWMAGMALAVALIINRGIPYVGWLRLADTRPAPLRGALGASLTAFLAPFVFVMGLWCWINWQIKGNPIFWLVGPGSTRESPDTAHVFGEGFPLYYAYGSISGTLELTISRIVGLSPLMLIATIVLAVVVLRRRSLEPVAIGIVAWSTIAFPIGTAYTGSLPPWVRYWYWLVPMGIVLACYGLSMVRGTGKRMFLTVPLVLLAFWPNLRIFTETYNAFDKEQPTHSERVMNAIFTNTDLYSIKSRQALAAEFEEVASWANRLTQPDDLILLDTVGIGGPVPMFAIHPQRYVTTTDRDFETSFLFQAWNTVDYVLVPFPNFDNQVRSILLQTYEEIWYDKEPWAELVAEIPGPSQWRLFRVIKPAAIPDASAAALETEPAVE